MAHRHAWIFVSLLAAAACSTDRVSSDSTLHIAELDIAELDITETNVLTTVIGTSAGHDQIARLDLIHGPYVLGTEYEQLAGTVGEGRKLTVQVADQSFEWDTVGFTDTSHMPRLPPKLNPVAQFLADPRVRPLLAKWKVGWLDGPSAGDGEVAYFRRRVHAEQWNQHRDVQRRRWHGVVPHRRRSDDAGVQRRHRVPGRLGHDLEYRQLHLDVLWRRWSLRQWHDGELRGEDLKHHIGHRRLRCRELLQCVWQVRQQQVQGVLHPGLVRLVLHHLPEHGGRVCVLRIR